MTTVHRFHDKRPTRIDPAGKTYAAIMKRMRRAEDRYAEILRERGWTVSPPEQEVS
jgi:hypothetical protein